MALPRFFAMREGVCLSLAGNGSNVPRSNFDWRTRLLSSHCSEALAGGIGFAAWRIGCLFIQLPVKRRAADLQLARHFRHLPAIVRNRKADDLALQFFQRPDLACTCQHREPSWGLG